jgi:hypothetical protein
LVKHNILISLEKFPLEKFSLEKVSLEKVALEKVSLENVFLENSDVVWHRSTRSCGLPKLRNKERS